MVALAEVGDCAGADGRDQDTQGVSRCRDSLAALALREEIGLAPSHSRQPPSSGRREVSLLLQPPGSGLTRKRHQGRVGTFVGPTRPQWVLDLALQPRRALCRGSLSHSLGCPGRNVSRPGSLILKYSVSLSLIRRRGFEPFWGSDLRRRVSFSSSGVVTLSYAAAQRSRFHGSCRRFPDDFTCP